MQIGKSIGPGQPDRYPKPPAYEREQLLRRLMTAANPEQVRARLGRFGFSQDKANVEIGKLSLCGVYMPNLLAKVSYWEAVVASLAARTSVPLTSAGSYCTTARL